MLVTVVPPPLKLVYQVPMEGGRPRRRFCRLRCLEPIEAPDEAGYSENESGPYDTLGHGARAAYALRTKEDLMASWPLVLSGSTGENVKTVQYLLDARGSKLIVDGGFGPLTKAAVVQFQGAQGLTADGIVGNATWPKLITEISVGSTGDAVRALQSQINSRIGFPTIDAVFGGDTDNLARSFQDDIGLGVDGLVGPKTWNALVNGFLTSADAVEAAQSMFDAWTKNDRASAAKVATPNAVNSLFSRPFSSTDGWTFSGSSGAAGTIGVEWIGNRGTLVLLANDDAGAPFFFVKEIVFP